MHFQCAQGFDAVFEQVGEGGYQAGHASNDAIGRHRHVECVVARGLHQHFQFHAYPYRIEGAHIHRQRFGQRPQSAWLLRSIHPYFERMVAAAVGGVRDEGDEIAERVFHHLRHPAFTACGQRGSTRPAQGRQCWFGRGFQLDAPVLIEHEILRLLVFLGLRCDRQYRTQHTVGPVGRQPLQSGTPGFGVEILEIVKGIVGWHVDGLADRGVDEGCDGGDHFHVIERGNFKRGDEGRRQFVHIAAEFFVEPPGVILNRIIFCRAVHHAFFARIEPREGRLNAVGCIVGEGQRNRAGGRDGQKMAVAYAMLPYPVLHFIRQARGEARGGQVLLGIEQRERAALSCQLD